MFVATKAINSVEAILFFLKYFEKDEVEVELTGKRV